MSQVEQLITDNLEVWTSAIKQRGSQGRGSSKKIELYGIKKLRELILELAVRGLLVPQDPNDEPASVLLESIAAEKEQLVKDGKLKKQKKLASISEDETPFSLPQGWRWARLGDICVLENGDRSKNYPNKSLLVDKGIPFVNAGHLQGGRIDGSEMTFITQERFDLLKAGKFTVGDILFCLRGSLGKSAIVDAISKGAIASSLVIVRLMNNLNRMFIHNYFDSPLSYSQIFRYDNGTAQPNLSAADLGKFLIPLPPEVEQSKIVRKIDELMALCDQLEQQTEDSLSAHQTLVETLLNALLKAAQSRDDSSSKESAFDQAWQRIAEHFDVLFTTEHSIDQLKQTILQLAVMGKLVPQDPNDEPASVLLEKITAEKERLVKEGKIKKQKKLPPISEEEKPFDLPHGWAWVRLGELSSDIHYGYTASADPDHAGTRLLRITDIQDDKVNWNTVPGCEITPEKAESYLLEDDDILIARTGGTIGKSYLVENISVHAVFASYLIRVKRISSMYAPYLKVYLGSGVYWSQLYDNASGTGQPNVNATALKQLMVPVAPLGEEPRIVAKVDELMAICDSLKAGIRESQTTQLHLADAMAESVLS